MIKPNYHDNYRYTLDFRFTSALTERLFDELTGSEGG